MFNVRNVIIPYLYTNVHLNSSPQVQTFCIMIH